MPQISLSSLPQLGDSGDGKPSIAVLLFSYGHACGPLHPSTYGGDCTKLLAYNIRHLPNPPRRLRAMTTGLSPRLQKEFVKSQGVEDLLHKVQMDLRDAARDEVDAFFVLHNKSTNGDPDAGRGVKKPNLDSIDDHKNNIDSSLATMTELLNPDPNNSKPDISLVLAVCCEEGRHRSVAFIEETARRLAELKNGDGESYTWRMRIHVSHRDLDVGALIDDPADSDLESGDDRLPKRYQESGRGRKQKRGGSRMGKRAILGFDDE